MRARLEHRNRGLADALRLADILHVIPDLIKEVLGLQSITLHAATLLRQAGEELVTLVTPLDELNIKVTTGNRLAHTTCCQVCNGLNVHMCRKAEFLDRRDRRNRAHQVTLEARELGEEVLQITEILVLIGEAAAVFCQERLRLRALTATRERRCAVDGATLETLLHRTSVCTTHCEVNTECEGDGKKNTNCDPFQRKRTR